MGKGEKQKGAPFSGTPLEEKPHLQPKAYLGLVKVSGGGTTALVVWGFAPKRVV